MKESKLNIQLILNENGLTSDVTDIHCHLSIPVTTPSISMSRKQYTLGTTGRLVRNNYPGHKDKMLYIKNIGKTNRLKLTGTKQNLYNVIKDRLKGGYGFYPLQEGAAEWLTEFFQNTIEGRDPFENTTKSQQHIFLVV